MMPLLDLQALNAPMQAEIEAALLRVARSGRYVLGPEVEAFEAEWAAYCGVKHCVGTGNAMEALEIILRAYGIGPGDEVIVPSNTYIATWLAVTHAGATPVPVEPDEYTYNIDPDRVASAMTPRTRAILAVHLYGRCAEMGQLRRFVCDNLFLIEDAAQAHGATDETGAKAGSLGHAAAFSFYPSKNLGALGDGGAITTNDGHLAKVARRLRNYGGVGRVDHTIKGINSRLDEIQAAVLRAKLPHLDAMNAGRRARARAYCDALGLVRIGDGGHVYHQFVIRSGHREELRKRLFDRHGIEAHVHYPVPPHLEGAYTDLGYGYSMATAHPRPSFPIAERLADEVLSLPIGNDVDTYGIGKTVQYEIEALQEEFA